MNNNASQQYKKTQFETANNEKLILMLYDGGIKFLNKAEKSFADENIDGVNQSLTKSQDIISELMVSLNLEAGGEIAHNLYQLYDYMRRRLIEANIKKNVNNVIEVRNMLIELRETWEQAMMQVEKNKTGHQGQGGLSLNG